MYLANCKINYGCMTYLHIEPLLTIVKKADEEGITTNADDWGFEN